MIDLIDIEEAKAQIHVTGTDLDQDIALKVMTASAIVYNYLKVDNDSPSVYPWTGDTPYDVKAAALLVFAELFVAREASTSDPLSKTVKDLLRRWRDPAIV